MRGIVLILDFGSQYTHLIKARLSDLGIFSVIEAADISVFEFKKRYPDEIVRGLIFSGGACSVYKHKISFDKKWLMQDLPVLGICYGHQLLASIFGGKVKKTKPEYGKERLIITTKTALFKKVSKSSVVWMSHSDTVRILPKGFRRVAFTPDSFCAAMENSHLRFYGLQFHPEVSHTQAGLRILSNFAKIICGLEPLTKWAPKDFIEKTRRVYSQMVGRERIIVGVSGGVDSMTTLALLRKFFSKSQVIAVYLDSGLMPVSTEREVIAFCKHQNIRLRCFDSSKIFLGKLRGVSNPTSKGKIVGKVFIEEFTKIAKKERATFFSQGTIWSDVVESGVTKFSAQIKPHHNVGGLPPVLEFKLIEPIRELFKDQVRRLAKYLKLPNSVVNKKVFPGPGFAIRVAGEVTRRKVDLVRRCTDIIEEVIYSSKIEDKIWMAFAVLIEASSLGVKGDARVENNEVIVVRIVESKNSMTANFSRRAFPFLEEISNRIVRETDIGRVVYDITDKPPATIEWQ